MTIINVFIVIVESDKLFCEFCLHYIKFLLCILFLNNYDSCEEEATIISMFIQAGFKNVIEVRSNKVNCLLFICER